MKLKKIFRKIFGDPRNNYKFDELDRERAKQVQKIKSENQILRHKINQQDLLNQGLGLVKEYGDLTGSKKGGEEQMLMMILEKILVGGVNKQNPNVDPGLSFDPQGTTPPSPPETPNTPTNKDPIKEEAKKLIDDMSDEDVKKFAKYLPMIKQKLQ